jgi:hypothetical protein
MVDYFFSVIATLRNGEFRSVAKSLAMSARASVINWPGKKSRLPQMTPGTDLVLMTCFMNLQTKIGQGTKNQQAARGCKQYFESDTRNIIFGKLFSVIRMTSNGRR